MRKENVTLMTFICNIIDRTGVRFILWPQMSLQYQDLTTSMMTDKHGPLVRS
jgi:hypothetical protein